MREDSGIDRRRLLLSAAAIPALSATRSLAQTAAPAAPVPARGEFERKANWN